MVIVNEVVDIYGMNSTSGEVDAEESIGERWHVYTSPGWRGYGCMHHSWVTQPYMKLAERLMHRAIEVTLGIVPPNSGIGALRVFGIRFVGSPIVMTG